MGFEILSAELTDLATDDPMRLAAIVHVLGDDQAQACYDTLGDAYSTYVIGRGPLPVEVGEGYFFVASRPDYPTLRNALADFWPGVPNSPPHRGYEPRQVQSQEIADVINYVAVPPLRDPQIFSEARRRLKGLVPKRHLLATAHVTQWLVENMAPANNCYTLATLFTRWLSDHDAPVKYRTGHATLRSGRHPSVTIPHAWVEVDGAVCDLTVDRQSAWGDFDRPVARIQVSNPRIVYKAGGGRHDLNSYWSIHSKPPDRPTYTEASSDRQAAIIRELVPGPLLDERSGWITLIWEHGIVEGTYRLLQALF